MLVYNDAIDHRMCRLIVPLSSCLRISYTAIQSTDVVIAHSCMSRESYQICCRCDKARYGDLPRVWIPIRPEPYPLNAHGTATAFGHSARSGGESASDFLYNSKCYAVSRNETYTCARARPLYGHTIVYGPTPTESII